MIAVKIKRLHVLPLKAILRNTRWLEVISKAEEMTPTPRSLVIEITETERLELLDRVSDSELFDREFDELYNLTKNGQLKEDIMSYFLPT